MNSWSFYRLEKMIEYKAILFRIQIFCVDPYNTSQEYSRCVNIVNQSAKSFKWSFCWHVHHPDANALFNIMLNSFKGKHRSLHIDRSCERITDIPKKGTPRTMEALVPSKL